MRIALGANRCLTTAPSEKEWEVIHTLSVEYGLVGVLYHGIMQLPPEQMPTGEIARMWAEENRELARRNQMANRATVTVFNWFHKREMRCCMLNGQGSAMFYPDAQMRTMDHIDIWVAVDYHAILDIARKQGVEGRPKYNRIKWQPCDGIDVNLYYYPSYLCNPKYNIRFRRWCRMNSYEQCTNDRELPGGAGKVALPTNHFNAIYQLVHMYNRYLSDGLGLRQLTDYFLLLADGRVPLLEVKKDLEELDMVDFARAVMWLMKEVFDLPKMYLLVEPDADRGRLLLREIISSGHFGKYDHRLRNTTHRYALTAALARFYRNLCFAWQYRRECAWRPAFRLWHAFWQIGNRL